MPRQPIALALPLCVAALVGSADRARAQPVGALPPGTPAADVQGLVVTAAYGEPIANAIVSLAGVARAVRSDSLGRFLLPKVPPGEYALQVSAVGYSPARTTVRVYGVALTVDVKLARLPTELESVRVEATADAPRNVAMKEFESRRIAGLGRFLTRADLVQDRGRSLDGILRSRVPGIRVLRIRNMLVAASGRSSGRIGRNEQCYVNVIVDGVLRPQPFDLRTLEASMIAGLEYYTPATIPAEFNLAGTAPCGTLAIWMQN